MRSLKLFILLVGFSCLSKGIHAQMRSEKFKLAEELVYRLKYYEAVDAYEEVLKESPDFTAIKVKLAKLYNQLNNYEKSIKFYEQLISLQPEDEPLLEYDYAVLLKKMSQYEMAINHFESFIKNYKGGDKSRMSSMVKDQIEGCERALLTSKDSSYSIRPLSEINSSYTDLSPVIWGNKLIYSTIPSDTPLVYIDEFGIQNFMELYEVPYDHYIDSAVSQPKKFGKNYWNEENANVTGGAFSTDGKRFYFSSCKLGLHGVSTCQIMGTALTDSGWTTPKNLGPQVNDPEGIFSSTHPALDEDTRKKRDILYFASNRPGGEGGFDLYEVEVDHHFNAGKIDNLGRRINSAGNEITPFIDPKDQSLYYSSDGLIGSGGYDIQKAKRKGRRLDKPEQLGTPFNTSTDEFFFSIIGEDKYLLVSNREGAQTYYKDYILDDIFLIYKPQIHKYLLVNVQLNNSAKTILGDLAISINGQDSILKCGVAWESPLDTLLELKTLGEGLINASTQVKIDENSPDTTLITLVVDQIIEEKEIRLNNIYFAFNSDSLTDSSKVELELLLKILTDNPLFKIEIGAHTDNIGKKQYNLELSQKRAQSVVTFLLEKGIREDRLVAKGYGMSQPIAPNELENGDDNPEGRKLNRRIVFKIIGTVEEEKISSEKPTSEYRTENAESKNTEEDDNEVFNKPEEDTEKTDAQEQTSIIEKEINPVESLKQNTQQIDSSNTLETESKKDQEKPEITNSIPEEKGVTPDNGKNRGLAPKKSDTLKTVSDKTGSNSSSEILVQEATALDLKFTSTPKDVSVTKNNYRWIEHPGAQLITCQKPISIKSLRVIAQKKTGVELKVRVVDSKTGNLIIESEVFIKNPSSAPSWMMTYFDIEVNCNLPQGSYFIFPVISSGNIAYLPNFTYKNTFEGVATISEGMYLNFSSLNKPIYEFKNEVESDSGLKHYGPFLFFQFSVLK